MRGNLVLVREVIANLIDNALKYIPPFRQDRARVTLSVTEYIDASGRRFGELAVEDNGPGVPHDQQPDLFKRFFRGDGQTVEGGAGLGLAIVHDIMVLHGGSVHYEDAPESGARFVVRMPLKPRGPGPVPGASPRYEKSHGSAAVAFFCPKARDAYFFFNASIVPRHFFDPQRHSYSFLSFFVMRPSMTRP